MCRRDSVPAPRRAQGVGARGWGGMAACLGVEVQDNGHLEGLERREHIFDGASVCIEGEEGRADALVLLHDVGACCIAKLVVQSTRLFFQLDTQDSRTVQHICNRGDEEEGHATDGSDANDLASEESSVTRREETFGWVHETDSKGAPDTATAMDRPSFDDLHEGRGVG